MADLAKAVTERSAERDFMKLGLARPEAQDLIAAVKSAVPGLAEASRSRSHTSSPKASNPGSPVGAANASLSRERLQAVLRTRSRGRESSEFSPSSSSPNSLGNEQSSPSPNSAANSPMSPNEVEAKGLKAAHGSPSSPKQLSLDPEIRQFLRNAKANIHKTVFLCYFSLTLLCLKISSYRFNFLNKFSISHSLTYISCSSAHRFRPECSSLEFAQWQTLRKLPSQNRPSMSS